MPVTPYPATSHPVTFRPAALEDSIRRLATVGLQPDAEASWRAHVAGLLSPLRVAFAAHRAATEGDAGLYANLVQDAPRLIHQVNGLVAEHAVLDGAMARLEGIAETVETDAEVIRHEVMLVLGDLARHRQRDSDLVYDAYSIDIGGE
jgi:hypothetical protein